MYSKVVEQNRGLRSDYRAGEEARRQAERRVALLERELAEARASASAAAAATSSASGRAAGGAGTATPTAASAAEEEDEQEEEEEEEEEEEVRLARRETRVLLRAVGAFVQPEAQEELRRRDVAAQAAAKAELERGRRSALWQALRETVDSQTFAAVARSVGGSCGGGQAPTADLGASAALTPRGRPSLMAAAAAACGGPPSSHGRSPKMVVASLGAAVPPSGAAACLADRDRLHGAVPAAAPAPAALVHVLAECSPPPSRGGAGGAGEGGQGPSAPCGGGDGDGSRKDQEQPDDVRVPAVSVLHRISALEAASPSIAVMVGTSPPPSDGAGATSCRGPARQPSGTQASGGPAARRASLPLPPRPTGILSPFRRLSVCADTLSGAAAAAVGEAPPATPCNSRAGSMTPTAGRGEPRPAAPPPTPQTPGSVRERVRALESVGLRSPAAPR